MCSVTRVISSANMVFVSVVHSISRIWPAPGQPHFCQGHFPREPGSQRRQHPGRGCSTEGEEIGQGLGSAIKKTPGNVTSFIYCVFVLPELTARSAIKVLLCAGKRR